MAIFLALLVMLFLHLRDHSCLQTSHLPLLSSPVSPYYPAPAHLTLSPLGLVLVFISRLWLCHFFFSLLLFWFRCLFSLSKLIQSHYFLQEPAQSSSSSNMPALTLITSLLFYCSSNLYNLYSNIICTCLRTLWFLTVPSQGKFPEVKAWIFLVQINLNSFDSYENCLGTWQIPDEQITEWTLFLIWKGNVILCIWTHPSEKYLFKPGKMTVHLNNLYANRKDLQFV